MKNLLQYCRLKVSLPVLVFLVALFQASLLNIPFYSQILQRFGQVTPADYLFILSIPTLIFFFIVLVLNIVVFNWLTKCLAILFIACGVPVAYFEGVYGIVFDKGMFQNVLETNSAETFSLMTPQLVACILVGAVIPILIILLSHIDVKVTVVKTLSYRAINTIFSIAILFLIFFFFYKEYASFFRNNRDLIHYITPVNYISVFNSKYKQMVQERIPFTEIATDSSKTPLKKGEKPTLMILVVGETARAQNFSLGGYEKNTNPLLSKETNLVYFKNTSSCGTYTGRSVPCMFSNMSRDEYDENLAKRRTNIIDVLYKSKVNVLWHGTNDSCKGVCDRVGSLYFTEKQNAKLCKGSVCYDEVLFDGVNEYIEKLKDSDAIIVLHTIGSHGPTYYKRYPEQFKVFKPTCDTNDINSCSSEQLTNTYDNTIVYTDYVLDTAIDILKKYQNKYKTILWYQSDHGESLGEGGVYLHAAPYAFAPIGQTHIPFVLWMSDDFKSQRNIDQNCLQQRAEQQKYSHDNLFHSLLSIYNIKTKEYKSELDIFKPCQKL